MIKQILFTILISACCSVAFCQSDETANVLAVERSTANAFTKHNTTYLTSVFADDIKIITAKGEIINKQQLLQYVPNVNSTTVSDMQVLLKSNIAVVTGVSLETGKDNSGVYSNKTRFTDVLEKIKGQWQIIASQATAMDQ